jgi:hypothetical protein
VTTSSFRISLLLEERWAEDVARALHRAFVAH